MNPRIRFGQSVLWRGERWRIGAEVCTPGRETVYLRRGGEAPGVEIPPEEWATATWDARGSCWVVTRPPERVA